MPARSAPHTIRTLTAAQMRAINRAAVLELIRRRAPISPGQIAEALQISLPTATRLVDGLLAENLVIESDETDGRRARTHRLLQFNGDAHLVLGIDLGGTKVYGAAATLSGKILYETSFEHHQSEAQAGLNTVCTVIDRLLAQVQDAGRPVHGIGLGVPGVVQPETGVVDLCPAFGWTDYPLKARLAARYPYPITVENDVNLAALGEVGFGADPGVEHLVLLSIGTGIGAGVVIDGAVHSGAHHMAGEVGYFLPERSHLGRSYPGFGALELQAAGPGVAARGRAALRGLRPAQALETLTAEDVFAAGRRGEAWAAAVLGETVDYLAQLVAAITLIVDPQVILLGGGVSRSADLLIEAMQKRLEGAIPLRPNIQVSHLGPRAAVMGAILQVLRLTSNHYSMQRS